MLDKKDIKNLWIDVFTLHNQTLSAYLTHINFFSNKRTDTEKLMLGQWAMYMGN